ncbi:MAG: ComEC/Rec2 family competence protein [Fimbriimonas sp.]
MSVRKALPFAAAVIVAAGWFGATRREPTRLTFLAVGQGDAVLFQHEGRALLVDAGPATHGRITVRSLAERGVGRLDLLLLTHPDLDHVGGAETILARHPETRLAVSEAFRADEEMQAHLRRWAIPAERVVWIATDAEIEIGAARVRLYSPPLPKAGEANAGSTFLHLAIEGATATLTGDAPQDVELRALRHGEWRAQVLKAGHHGSRTSTAQAFLDAVKPTWLVISCGRDNPYGHPAREVLDRAAQAKVEIVRTDREGDLTFEIRDGRFAR